MEKIFLISQYDNITKVGKYTKGISKKKFLKNRGYV